MPDCYVVECDLPAVYVRRLQIRDTGGNPCEAGARRNIQTRPAVPLHSTLLLLFIPFSTIVFISTTSFPSHPQTDVAPRCFFSTALIPGSTISSALPLQYPPNDMK